MFIVPKSELKKALAGVNYCQYWHMLATVIQNVLAFSFY